METASLLYNDHTYLQLSNNRIFSNNIGYFKPTGDFAIPVADDESRMHIHTFFLQRDRLGEMYIGELLAIEDIPCVILDDQPEFFGRRVFELYAEYNIVIVVAHILNGYLLVIQIYFFIAAISQAGQGIADKEYNGYRHYRKDFCDPGTQRFCVHTI